MGKILIAISTLLMICIAAGCNTSGCTENQSSVPLAEFYASETGDVISLTNVEIGGVGAPHDSLLSNGRSAISQIYLPFRSTKQTTSFYFHYKQEGIDSTIYNDTITFDYTSQPTFVSEECGAMFFYKITKLENTTHLIDSVAIIDSLITNTDIKRLGIYFKTDSGEGDTE